jgi:N-methylhydantoinase A
VIRIGVDTGGTFTDVAVLGRDGGIETFKLPSTPADPGRAVSEGIRNVRAERPITGLVHGTTVATNALLEAKAPHVALVVTAGFRDVLEIGRQDRPSMFDLFSQPVAPLSPRYLRFEVRERMSYRGEPTKALDEAEMRQVARDIAASEANSVAVCFLHSYVNDLHERRAREILLDEAPRLDVTISSAIVPEFKEYERMSTSVVNAYVKPSVCDYLGRLSSALRDDGIDGFQVMQSNGGMIGADAAGEHPVQTVLSGPAAGALAGADTGAIAGYSNVMSVDMGGTSFDISVAVDRTLLFRTESEIAGRAIKVPIIDIHTLGAGGGSIAWIDKGGGLRVGPESSGAIPGPACYGRGGKRPTVTDANVVLGRFDARGLLGGTMAIDEGAARAAIQSLAQPLGLGVERAAEGVIEVVNTLMVGGMRYLSVERGHDPREFALVAFGGGGPAHAVDLARALNMCAVVVPPHPGLHSAVGLLQADYRHDFVATLLMPLDSTVAVLEERFQILQRQALETFDAEGIDADAVKILRLVEARYAGQGATLSMPVAALLEEVAELRDDFDALHEHAYGFANITESVEIVNLRLVATARVEKPRLAQNPLSASDGAVALVATKPVIFGGIECTTSVYDRSLLQPGAAVMGPAIIHQVDSTTVVHPDHQVLVDEHQNLVITPVGKVTA